MSKVNVGFVDGRSCSRILKPPGGGYSELFFANNETDSPKKVPPVKKTESQLILENMSKEQEIKTEKISKELKEEVEVKSKEVKIEEEKTESKSEETIEVKTQERKIEEVLKIEEKMEELKVKEEVTPKRTRVPPGGFSSGLW